MASEAPAPGDRVRTRVMNPPGHCRLPRYARGRVGVVERVQGRYPLADRLADDPPARVEQQVCTVRFTAEELWGKGAHTVSLDLWEAHLERMTDTDGCGR